MRCAMPVTADGSGRLASGRRSAPRAETPPAAAMNHWWRRGRRPLARFAHSLARSHSLRSNGTYASLNAATFLSWSPVVSRVPFRTHPRAQCHYISSRRCCLWCCRRAASLRRTLSASDSSAVWWPLRCSHCLGSSGGGAAVATAARNDRPVHGKHRRPPSSRLRAQRAFEGRFLSLGPAVSAARSARWSGTRGGRRLYRTK